jgi:hypothetical protein
MNVRKGILSVWVLLVLASAAYADSVAWMSGSTPPKQWGLDPANPTTTDVITFNGPTSVYANSCLGERDLGGTPQILVDSKTMTVTLWFQGPVPQVCTMIYSPVAGLKGDFGPLPAGDWTFTCPTKNLYFQIPFTVRDKFDYHVDPNAPGAVHDGRSWATALLTLQDALAAVSSGDRILVAEGTYKPDKGGTAIQGDRQASFTLKEGVTIRGGYAGYGQPNPDERDLTKHQTILNGDLKGNDKGSLNLADNSFHVVVGPPDGLAATLDGLIIAGGDANGPYPYHYGGGLYNPDGKVQALNCTFQGNTGVCGAAVMNLGTSLTLVNCHLVGNHALMLGGGLYNYQGAATLINCRIVGNTADYANVVGGAAIYNEDGSMLTVLDSTIADNRPSTGRALANFLWGTTSLVRVRVANSILFNGGSEIWTNFAGLADVTYSDVQGGWSGTGNISTDPQFIHPGSWATDGTWVDGDYRLQGTSPAIDVGSNAALPVNSFDLKADGNVTEALPLDLAGAARVQGAQVDMGAYEQLAQKPASGVTLIASVGDGFVTLARDPNAPLSSNTFYGTSDVNVAAMGFRGKLTVQVAATSAAGGTWTGGVNPDTVGPGAATVSLWVRGANLNLAALPADAKTVQVAAVTVYITPVQ